MLLDLSPDQEFFRDTTARFLSEKAPVGTLRALRRDPRGHDPDHWRQGAELGWTSLLVAEEHGGGSISGSGLLDLTLVAHEFGAHAAPGPLIPTNLVAAALSEAGGAHPEVLAGLLEGSVIATPCTAEGPPHDALGTVTLDIRAEGGGLVLDGTKRPVESAGSASHLLVTGRTDGGLTQVLVPADSPGIRIEPLATVDLTRRFDAVRFDGVRVGTDAVVGDLGGADDQVERQLQLAMALANAECVGAMGVALDLTVEWAFDRYSFGRPLASYQALKHRFADMKTWLEASHGIADAAAVALAAGEPGAPELNSAAKAYIGQHGAELMQDCVQLHGGIGLTFEHDLHLYMRRLTVDRMLYGTPADHRQRLAASAVERAEAHQREDAA